MENENHDSELANDAIGGLSKLWKKRREVSAGAINLCGCDVRPDFPSVCVCSGDKNSSVAGIITFSKT